MGIGRLRDLVGEWNSCCVVVRRDDGSYLQHYSDSRGVARLYAMTFDPRIWTLERTKPDLSPPDFHSGSSDPSATTARPSTGSGKAQTTASSGRGTSG